MPFKILLVNTKSIKRILVGRSSVFNVRRRVSTYFCADFNTGTENVEKSTEMCVCFQLEYVTEVPHVDTFTVTRSYDEKLLFRVSKDVKNDFDGDDDADAKKSEEAVVVEEKQKWKTRTRRRTS